MAETSAKKKRRIKPSQPTLRQQAEIARAQDEKSKQPGKAKKALTPVGKFWAKIFRPVKWLARHIVPRYVRNSFAELKDVTWPNFKQSHQLTTAVLVFAVVFGFLVTILDYGLDKVFKKVFLKE